jgi:imidazole glycerol-phosphate synthase subunit HisF
MLARRVIPCLDVDKGRVVKGTKFLNLTDEGDPAELAELYAHEGADEIVFLDITAAHERRGTMLEVVRRTASRAFVPLTVGGGVRSVDEMRDVLRAGADKVSFNTAAVAEPALLRACAERFGSQAVVCAIDARRLPAPEGTARGDAAEGAEIAAGGSGAGSSASGSGAASGAPRWEVVTHGGRRATELEAVTWAMRAVEMGAGELLVTSMDRDGTRSGFDTELLAAIATRVRVPVIASGGASGPADFVTAVRDGKADAVLAASIFHRRMFSVGDIKEAMAAAGLPVRRIEESGE